MTKKLILLSAVFFLTSVTYAQNCVNWQDKSAINCEYKHLESAGGKLRSKVYRCFLNDSFAQNVKTNCLNYDNKYPYTGSNNRFRFQLRTLSQAVSRCYNERSGCLNNNKKQFKRTRKTAYGQAGASCFYRSRKTGKKIKSTRSQNFPHRCLKFNKKNQTRKASRFAGQRCYYMNSIGQKIPSIRSSDHPFRCLIQ